MNVAKRYLLGLSILFAACCGAVRADVGACWVMFVYQTENGLNAEQQKEIGERLMQAHMNSNGSDRHTLLICHLDPRDEGVLYRISEIENEIFSASERFCITARDFDAMRLAVADVERGFAKGRPEVRVQKIPADAPNAEQRTPQGTESK